MEVVSRFELVAAAPLLLELGQRSCLAFLELVRLPGSACTLCSPYAECLTKMTAAATSQCSAHTGRILDHDLVSIAEYPLYCGIRKTTAQQAMSIGTLRPEYR